MYSIFVSPSLNQMNKFNDSLHVLYRVLTVTSLCPLLYKPLPLMATNTPSSPSPHKRSSLAGLIESTIPLSFISSHRPTDEMSANNNKKSEGGASPRKHTREPPARVFSQPSKIDEQVHKGERSSRPSSLTVDQPLSPRSDRSPSDVIRVLRDSVFDSDSDTPTSLPGQQMQPRRPTGAEWNPKSRSPIGSETDVVSFHEVLKQLDKQEA